VNTMSKKALLYIFVFLFGLPAQSFAQSVEQNAMSKLSFLVGNWSGEGISYNDGNESTYYDSEFVRYDLDGQLLLINAKGSVEGKTRYELHTVIHFDAKSGKYIYSPYTAKGTRPFTCQLLNKQLLCYSQKKEFRLVFQRLTNGLWNEYGERKVDGKWQKTFETKLSAVN